MSKKKIALIIIVLVLLGIGVYRIAGALAPAQVAEQPPVNVQVATAEAGSIFTTSLLTGRIEAVDEAAVVPLAVGEVTSLNVSLGDYIEKGKVLFTIDSAQMAAAYNQTQAAYNQALLAQQSALSDLERYKSLYEAGALSEQQYQQAELQCQVAEQTLATATAARSSASDGLSNCTVTAPISGYVTSVNVAVGSIAAQGSPAITLANTDDLQISVAVSEYLVGNVHLGDPVDIYITTLSDEPFTGTVTALSPAPAMGTLTYPATISVDNEDGSIMAGMFAEIRIESERRDNVLCIPSDAVFMKSGQSTVAVLENELPVLKPVSTGLDDGEKVEILEGIAAGDTIIISGQQYVTEGEPVKIVE